MNQLSSSGPDRLLMLLVFLLPIVMGTIAGAANLIAIVLILFSFKYVLPDFKNIDRLEKLLFCLFGLFFFAALISFVNSEDIGKSWARLERLLRVLAFIPIFFLFYTSKTDLLKPLSLGMLAAGPVLLLSALITLNDGRSSGAYNAILFGDYASYVSVFLLGFLAFSNSSRKIKLYALLSLCCSTQAMILSGTRGAWAALAVCCIVSFYLLFVKIIQTRRPKKLIWLSLALVALFAILVLQIAIVQQRLASAEKEFLNFLDGSNPHTSLGFRFQLWEACIALWNKNPIIGSGLGDFSEDLKALMQRGEIELTEHFGEAHSIYFEFLATTGTLGLVLCLLSMFVVPFLLAFRAKNSVDGLFVKTQLYLFLISFFIFGLTQNWLSRSSITSVFFILLAVFLSELKKNHKNVRD